MSATRRVAVITGAAQGIGKAHSGALGRKGICNRFIVPPYIAMKPNINNWKLRTDP